MLFRTISSHPLGRIERALQTPWSDSFLALVARSLGRNESTLKYREDNADSFFRVAKPKHSNDWPAVDSEQFSIYFGTICVTLSEGQARRINFDVQLLNYLLRRCNTTLIKSVIDSFVQRGVYSHSAKDDSLMAYQQNSNYQLALESIESLFEQLIEYLSNCCYSGAVCDRTLRAIVDEIIDEIYYIDIRKNKFESDFVSFFQASRSAYVNYDFRQKIILRILNACRSCGDH